MLDRFLEDIERRRKRLTVYSSEDQGNITERLATRNVTVERRQLPSGKQDPFVTIHDDEEFVAAIALDDLHELLTPPVARQSHQTGKTAGCLAVLDAFEETLFSSLERRQLLATTREIEDRALRTGRGTLRVSFQSLSAFEPQIPVYRRLGTKTDLDIHIYGRPDWTPPDLDNVTYHQDREGKLTQFWCLAFDGGNRPTQACALVARERERVCAHERDGRFEGFWSYDNSLVSDILSTLEKLDRY